MPHGNDEFYDHGRCSSATFLMQSLLTVDFIFTNIIGEPCRKTFSRLRLQDTGKGAPTDEIAFPLPDKSLQSTIVQTDGPVLRSIEIQTEITFVPRYRK